jgi:electron transfer flavoprotein alpha subunit
MAGIFAYIAQKNGIVDDGAADFLAAANKIDAAAPVTAILIGCEADLESACAKIRGMFGETWKVANQALAYPNAELVRKALVKILPAQSILLVAHDHFGTDLSPGLSIKLNATFVSDVVDITGIQGAKLTLVRQEFGGQLSTHVRCDISSGAVLNLRPGAFKAAEAAAVNGTIVDKSAEVGELVAGRRYLQTIAAEAGDVQSWTRSGCQNPAR